MPNDVWLVRKAGVPSTGTVGTTVATPDFQTMQTDMYLQNGGGVSHNLFLGNNTLYGGSDTTTSAGAIKKVQTATIGDATYNSNSVLIVNGPTSGLDSNGTGDYGPNCGDASGRELFERSLAIDARWPCFS